MAYGAKASLFKAAMVKLIMFFNMTIIVEIYEK